MKVNLDKLEGLTRRLTLEVPAQTITQAFEAAYRDVQKGVSIKGFRKGKVPLNLIRNRYSEQVKSDVLQFIVNSSYNEALNTHELDPVGDPKIFFDRFENDQDFSFTVEFEVKPEIDLKKVEGLEIEQEKKVISEHDIEKVLKSIQNKNAEYVPVFENRPAQLGDVAIIDLEGFVEGQLLPGAQMNGHKLELGSGQFIPGFEEGLVGVNVGAKTDLHLSFPTDYHNTEVAGKPVHFQVTLKELKKKILPDINDELAQKAGSYNHLQELKENIQKELQQREEQSSQSDLKSQILKALVNENPVEVPKGLHAKQKKLLIENMQERMKQQGHSPADFDDYCAKWDEDFNQSATFMIQSHFLIQFLAQKLSLLPSHEELHRKIHEMAHQTGLSENLLSDYYHKPENQNRLTFQLMEEKVVNYLIEKAQIKEKMINE